MEASANDNVINSNEANIPRPVSDNSLSRGDPLARMPARAAHKAATLHDVAREAGVSLITASRALTNPKLVSPRTIEKVQAAAETVGYIPNLLAGGLKSKRSLMVAGLVPTISVAQFLP